VEGRTGRGQQKRNVWRPADILLLLIGLSLFVWLVLSVLLVAQSNAHEVGAVLKKPLIFSFAQSQLALFNYHVNPGATDYYLVEGVVNQPIIKLDV
jgi:hypothetical protein